MTDTSKKLSLEERLSLAAKKSKRKNKKSPVLGQELHERTRASDTSDSRESEEKDNDSKDEKIMSSLTVFDREPVYFSENSATSELEETSKDNRREEENDLKNELQILNSLKNKEPWSYFLDKSTEFFTIDGFIENLESALQTLYRELQSYKDLSDRSREPDNAKDELIGQLRYEGERLAETELRQNITIKSLRKKIGVMDNDFRVTQEELSKNINNYERLFNSHEDLKAQLNNCKVTVKNLIQDKTSLEELHSQSEEAKKEAEALRSGLQLNNQQFKRRENDLIKEIHTMKSSFQEQITQLETTLEKLRIELDNGSKGNEDKIVLESRGIEKALKEELKSLKFNSSQLENSLTSKISDLEADLFRLKQSNTLLEDQLQSFRRQNGSLKGELDNEIKEKEDCSVKLKKLQQERDRLQKSLQDSLEDYSLLQKKYEIRHAQLESSVIPIKKARKSPQLLDVPNNQKDNIGSSSMTEDDWMSPHNMSRISSMGTHMDFENSSIQKEVDEVSDRPPIDVDNLSIDGIDIPDEAAAVADSIQELNSTSKLTNSANHYKHTTRRDSTGQVNAHMISKLGAEIRRYEVELASLQNNCERLQGEKTEASNEILRLLEDNERVCVLSKEKDGLAMKIEEVQKELDSSLRVLGWKTKRIEELENDVADLKEVMQQQIQQMADMQERLR